MPVTKGEVARLVRFAAAGSATTVTTYAAYAVLLALGCHYNLALAGEYALGIAMGFLLNRRWTFRDHRSGPGAFRRYAATYGLVFAVNLGLLNALVGTGLHPLPAQAVALALATALSYTLQKHWVFQTAPARLRRSVP